VLAYASASCIVYYSSAYDHHKYTTLTHVTHVSMLRIDPTTSSCLDSPFGSTGSHLVLILCVCMGLASGLHWLAWACMGLHMQVQARTGTCICTCISLKSLHDFLAWYLHDASPVFAWYLHGSCMHMQVPCKSDKPLLCSLEKISTAGSQPNSSPETHHF